MKILVTPTSLQPGRGNSAAIDKLHDFADEVIFNDTGKPLEGNQLIELLQDCDGYIAGLDSITSEVIDSCPKLKAISRYGVGYDRVDMKAAAARGIVVANTPGANSEAVGELAFALVLAVARKIPYLDSETRKGGWVRSTGMELKGKTMGIMGLGAIGRVAARCGQGFGMRIMAYDPYINQEYCRSNHIEIGTFEEVLIKADVISLHLPLTDQTRHIIDKKAFDAMQDGTILINASRGGIIDEDAAYDALKSGKLAGLGLDAFEEEPPENSRLFEFPNVVTTPHTGAHTKEAADRMADMAVDNLIDILSGKECRFIVRQ